MSRAASEPHGKLAGGRGARRRALHYVAYRGHLHATCIHGRLPMMRLLLSRGARLDVRDREHDATPLGWAEHFHHARAARFLSARMRRTR